MPTTTLTDIHSDIIRSHILPKLDGRSLSATTAVSSDLHHLCSDHSLWTHISTSMWPSITHPRVSHVISTFPNGHHSFFQDSFPALSTSVNRHPTLSPPKQPDDTSCHFNQSSDHMTPTPETFMSAVDVRFRDDVVYSAMEFTDSTVDFLSSELQVGLSNNPTCNPTIDVGVDELVGADKATLSDLKQSVTLSWILIDPTRKRACNLSSIKPVSARQDWMSNETVLQYVTVLPGSDPGEVVQCKIQLVLGVCIGGIGLHVKHVSLKLVDLDCRRLSGRDFLVIMRGVLLEENNNVRRKVIDDDNERWKGHLEFKELKRERKKWERMEEEKREFAIKMNYVYILVSFCFSIYFLILSLR